MTIHSTFCHKSPLVEFLTLTGKSTVEIGDLLIVFFHQTKQKVVYRNALLLQAKQISKNYYNVPVSECDQLF